MTSDGLLTLIVIGVASVFIASVLGLLAMGLDAFIHLFM